MKTIVPSKEDKTQRQKRWFTKDKARTKKNTEQDKK
jgi:hypothetical protein